LEMSKAASWAASHQKKTAITQVDLHSLEARAKMKEKAKIAANFFVNIGKVDGLQIWHVEKFNLVEVPKEKHGSFFSDDSYVVLKTNVVGKETMWHVHYWIGETSTADEYGVAAYATVEIDQHFGGKPTNHREVMGHESDLFKSYFPHGVQILQGGIATGFHHVDGKAEWKNRLLHVKGKKHIQMTEVPCTGTELNSGDAFVLDTYNFIFVWLGKDVSPFERNKAGMFATALREQRHMRQTIVTLEDGRDDNAEFWKVLGGRPAKIHTAAEGGSDLDADVGKSDMKLKKVVQISDASGSMKIDVIAEGKFGKNVLKSSEVYIIDSGYEIFVWIGLNSDQAEVHDGWQYAQTYLNQSRRPPYLPITKVVEGTNLPSFEAVFATV